MDAFDPQIILLDIMMPGGPSSELAETFLERKSNVGITIVTPLEEEGVHFECFIKGAFEVVTEPIDFENLKDTIERVLAEQD